MPAATSSVTSGIKGYDMRCATVTGTAMGEAAAGEREAWLVDRARRGDANAFEALLRRHRTGVLNLAWRIVGDPDAAQDVAQEALLSAWRQLPRFRRGAAFGTWLYRITVNAARGHLRSHSRRQARDDRYGGLTGSAAPTRDPEPDPGGPVTALLMQLPEKQRVALALFYVQDLSLEEIARAAGAPVGTVKAWLSRGRARLREMAEDGGLL
ncbi:MAG: sigma-70 family RNA polymerase sigma factor [Armatimonadetes bacterium]|nr:sigma-70 family RNA polymerase sigma factor [Armatimonadota bacterium]